MDAIQEALRQKNPFLSGVAGNPWNDTSPDVFSLNKEAYEAVCDLIRGKNENPRIPMAGLILGEAGMGKTHLLKRILHATQQPEDELTSTFVFVKPLLDPDHPLQHLLREIAVDLGKSKGGKICQFERLVAYMAGEYGRYLPQFDENEWLRYFRNEIPEVNDDLLKVLFAYRKPANQGLVLSWLRGSIDEEHVEKLGVQDREGMSDGRREDDARHALESLGLLMERYRLPMVVCFDQLEGMRDAKIINAFGNIVQTLVNDVVCMLPLTFIRGDFWNNHFKKLLDSSVSERLSLNTYLLSTCTLEQARELIARRVENGFQNAAQEKIDWLLGRLEKILKAGYAPRLVIQLANRAITETTDSPAGTEKEKASPPAESSVEELFKDEYLQEREKVAADFSMWPPDAERLKLTLHLWLEQQNYVNVQLGKDKFVSLTAERAENGTKLQCAFIVNTAEHPKTVEAAFNRGTKFLAQYPDGFCVYITDKRCKFKEPKHWVKVHLAKEAFLEKGGKELFLDQRDAIDWYSLTSLIFKIDAGDVSISTGENFHVLTRDDLGRYLKNGFEKNLLEPSGKDPAKLEQHIRKILEGSPMRILSTGTLLGRLGMEGSSIDGDFLLSFFNEREDVFTQYPASDGSSVMLNLQPAIE